ncbi:hypothetical protein CDD80_7407 [Ophiocordyceps camponoti-rufipedis]|uniref:Uncharacterized protein n=1 Tax=Ophiocordyceps camponoti-rufipedis TaxID=2004952 RepID=A0A2C5YMQ7_9HYPO|nr:hypothetical protein CDD80_7407 [Ophiocordyceps camponoti-rufipedis]
MNPLARAWFAWKALRLPWRKRFLAGYDLSGNTYWEFRLTSRGPPSKDQESPSGERWRRIVQYPASTYHSEVKVSPLWHQWLRHQRSDPPSLAEQSHDVVRQQRIKLLAAEADKRWEAKPRLVDDDATANRPALPNSPDPRATPSTHAPGEAWQPAAWSPPAREPQKP